MNETRVKCFRIDYVPFDKNACYHMNTTTVRFQLFLGKTIFRWNAD